jgi:hypothetical protein
MKLYDKNGNEYYCSHVYSKEEVKDEIIDLLRNYYSEHTQYIDINGITDSDIERYYHIQNNVIDNYMLNIIPQESGDVELYELYPEFEILHSLIIESKKPEIINVYYYIENNQIICSELMRLIRNYAKTINNKTNYRAGYYNSNKSLIGMLQYVFDDRAVIEQVKLLLS